MLFKARTVYGEDVHEPRSHLMCERKSAVDHRMGIHKPDQSEDSYPVIPPQHRR